MTNTNAMKQDLTMREIIINTFPNAWEYMAGGELYRYQDYIISAVMPSTLSPEETQKLTQIAPFTHVYVIYDLANTSCTLIGTMCSLARRNKKELLNVSNDKKIQINN